MAHTEYVPLGQIDISLLADNVSVATTHTLNFSQGVLDLALAVHVSVQQTSRESERFFGKVVKIHTARCARSSSTGPAARATW